MSKIKIDFPESMPFKHDFKLRVEHINYGGHLGNDSVLTLCQNARIDTFNQFQLSEINIGNEIGIIQTDAVVLYKSEAHINDLIEIEVGFDHFTPARFDIFYRLMHKSNGRVIAEVKTGMVAFNYQEKRPSRIPESFTALFQK